MAESQFVAANRRSGRDMLVIGDPNWYAFTLVKQGSNISVEVNDGSGNAPSMSLDAQKVEQVLNFINQYFIPAEPDRVIKGAPARIRT